MLLGAVSSVLARVAGGQHALLLRVLTGGPEDVVKQEGVLWVTEVRDLGTRWSGFEGVLQRKRCL